MRPLAIDLYCKAGGAGMGLHRAGFDVVGVDIEPQPNYPFAFVQGNALKPPVDLSRAQFIWASPPCQKYSWSARRWRHIERADLLPATRDMLSTLGIPFVLENVVGAPLRADLVLTGQMFGLRVIRRRHFEMQGFWAMQPLGSAAPRVGFGPENCVTVAGHGGQGSGRLDNWRDAMGIDWMTKPELAEAIPPAYGEYIGRAAMRYLESRVAA